MAEGAVEMGRQVVEGLKDYRDWADQFFWRKGGIMSLNEIMSATAYVTGTPFSQIESLKRNNNYKNLEDAYKHLLFDEVLEKKFQWQKDSSFGFKQM